jgi:hypothetical protein
MPFGPEDAQQISRAPSIPEGIFDAQFPAFTWRLSPQSSQSQQSRQHQQPWYSDLPVLRVMIAACITHSHDQVTDEPTNPLRPIDSNPRAGISYEGTR